MKGGATAQVNEECDVEEFLSTYIMHLQDAGTDNDLAMHVLY